MYENRMTFAPFKKQKLLSRDCSGCEPKQKCSHERLRWPHSIENIENFQWIPNSSLYLSSLWSVRVGAMNGVPSVFDYVHSCNLCDIQCLYWLPSSLNKGNYGNEWENTNVLSNNSLEEGIYDTSCFEHYWDEKTKTKK